MPRARIASESPALDAIKIVWAIHPPLRASAAVLFAAGWHAARASNFAEQPRPAFRDIPAAIEP